MTYFYEYIKSVKKGLAHVGGHMDAHKERESIRLDHINSGTGDPEACKSGLRQLAATSALMSWFAERDLAKFKQEAYVAGKLDRIIYQNNSDRGIWAPLVQRNVMLWPLLSDNPQLAGWFGAFDAIDLKRAAKGGTFEFETYQSKLALRGEWDKLGERSERFLANVPERMKRFVPDNRFYLALAKGDVGAMETALAEMVTPKELKWRTDDGYTGWFIVCEAVIYAKIAWRHGYEVAVDTPWIPAEWLPVRPLSDYHDPYLFMQAFDIDTPIPS